MSTAIENFVAGDDMDIRWDVTQVVPTDPLVKAWLTVKRTPSLLDPGALQKIITTTPVTGTGQITADGSEGNGNGTASVLFQLTAANTLALGYNINYYFDIQVKTFGSKIYTVELDPTGDPGVHVGRMQLLQGVTDALT